MQSGRIILIGGGVRSGKSSFAVDLAQKLGRRRTFIATATPCDDDMRTRIERHQRDRQDAFTTVEAPIALAEALGSVGTANVGTDDTSGPSEVVVVDCLTVWLANLLIRKDPADAILGQVDRVVRVLEERRFHAILVSNEVGMSVHPETALGRAFVEVCGWAHQRISRVADDVYLAVLGTIVQIRPGPMRQAGGEK